MNNYLNGPFNVSFGELPNNLIVRNNEFDYITSVFESDTPETKVISITGARGCGKTVLLTQVKKYFDDLDNWFTVDINPIDDVMEQIVSKLYDKIRSKKLFIDAEIDFSFKGFGISVKENKLNNTMYTYLDKILKYLKKKNYRVLITIDDISSNDYVKKFTHSYQSMIREGYYLFLLITGLYENIEKIENNKSLTFLARTPKLYLNKLSLKAITYSYMDCLNLTEDEAVKIAKQTNGYAYAFQLLGNILYKSEKTKVDKEVLRTFDTLLDENSYSLIWKSLTNKEKNFIFMIVKYDGKNKEIIENTAITNSYIQIYKKRLVKKGILDEATRGTLVFSLPRFKEFAEFEMKLEED